MRFYEKKNDPYENLRQWCYYLNSKILILIFDLLEILNHDKFEFKLNNIL